LHLGEVVASPFGFTAGTAQIDLNLNLEEIGGTLFGAVEYSTELYDTATVDRIMSQLQALLTRALDAPEKRLSELVAPFAEADRQRLEQRRAELGRARASDLKSTKRKAVRGSQG
jgi:non-ribosomal peptide synthetase component F